jgi:hypothetical protein
MIVHRREDIMGDEDVIFSENFEGYEDGSAPSGDWWVEGGENVWIESGHLRVKANPEGKYQPGYVCTVWNKRVFPGSVQVEFDAHVLDSTVNANNINFFLLYTDPAGRSLYNSRASRASGEYRFYHELNGYIFTFLNDRDGNAGHNEDGSTKARFRMRRCPGFHLLTETYGYHCKRGVTYHVTIAKREGHLTLAVDGSIYLEAQDNDPWTEGLIGLRTFQTDLWWDNIVITELK